jgi:arginyl-tRNA synthetase
LLRDALERVAGSLGVPDAEIKLERPREADHGDVATNLAMQLAGRLRQPPRKLAEQIVAKLELDDNVVNRVEIAGPGFINFWLAGSAVASVLPQILQSGNEYGRSAVGRGRRVNVEFVSANPTGPLHVGHGRGAALGDAIASLLEATGHEVVREFYVNDAGVQIDRLAESVWARVQQALGREAAIPDGGYHGEYVKELANDFLMAYQAELDGISTDEGLRRCRELATQALQEEQNQDLLEFGITFDRYTSERSLYNSGALAEALEALIDAGVTFEHDGALWLRTEDFGDEKNRVIRKSDGTFTYLLPDIAYHRDKAARGFDLAIDVWGADHHGYVARMSAAMKALGLPGGFFKAVLVQLVRVTRHGEEVRFSKRSGDFVTLRDLVSETGVDAARYFFLMRKGDSQFVFDIDLATKQSDENPVYYVQYAHTRLVSIFRSGDIDPAEITVNDARTELLTAEDEIDLMKQLASYPDVLHRAAEALEPHRVIGYLEDLARLVHGWYHRHRVLGEAPEMVQARLVLARAVQIVLANGLRILGIAAPERM